jgi:SAM-dependent methyltransferase
VDDLKALFEDRAAQQYAEAGALPDARIDRKFARICALVREQLPCEAFLDAGCGDGRYLAALAGELPPRRAGVDISERILETARQRVDADLRQANLEALPFRDGEFDVVLCSQVIEHVLDADAAVAELVRVLRPGGTLVISTDNARNYVTRTINAPRTAAVRALRLQGARGRIESPATPYTRRAFGDLLARGGLTVQSLDTFRFHLMWPLDARLLTRALNAVDSHVHTGFGDIVVAVAHR